MKTHTPAQKSNRASRPRRKTPATPFFQKKPTARVNLQQQVVTGRPGDAYEREADDMADAATGRAAMPDTPLYARVSPLVQAKAEEEALQAQVEEEALQAQADETEPVQTKTDEVEAVQAQADEEPVQAQADEEPVQAQADEEPIQAQADETEPVQAQADEEPVQAQADETEPVQAQADEEPVQAQGGEEAVQARSHNAALTVAPDDVQARIQERRGRGQSLSDGLRIPLERKFGADFSGVRIHTDDPAIQLSRQLNAQAFTQGGDIFFNQGRFAPGTQAGDHLLAHELTHTIQQGASGRVATLAQTTATALQRQEENADTIMIRPELLEAIKLARGEIGKVNAKKTGPDGNRMGWERLYDYFFTAFGEKELIQQDIIKHVPAGGKKDIMPSWCGIFVWWSYKKSGIPIPDWKLGTPILGQVKARAPGELPKKGDIAYRAKFQHFAMVTGVESAQDAAGKSHKSILVATINGNTSGDDNLGGQIEEKWEPISKWLGFFDPVAKLDMPPVPLVETGVEPDEFTPGAEADEEAAESIPETPPTDVSHLEEPVATPDLPLAEGEADVPTEPPEPATAPVEEVVPELPPPPAPPAPETVPKVEPLPLEGKSEKAMTDFTQASPSQMAATEPGLGDALDGKLKSEQKEEVANAPKLVAQTSGKADEGLTPPDQIGVPAGAEIGDGVTGADPGSLTAKPHENKGETPSNVAQEKELDKADQQGGFLDWLRNNMKSFLSKIRTKDPGVNTSAGERPNVKLEGESDPGRINKQRNEAAGQMVAERDKNSKAFKNHPGQKNIKPREVKEKKTATPTAEVKVDIQTPQTPSAADFANAPLAADVRAQADSLLKPKVDANMAAARTETEKAAKKRDQDKASEISTAESKVDDLNKQADKDQRNVVVKNRKEVAGQQKKGIEEAYSEVNAFNKEADGKQNTARKEIGDKVKESEGQARKELEKGEKDAEKKKDAEEKKAQAKKEQLKKEQKNDSWWDRVKSAVKKAVKAITSAIDAIFNALRKAVKFIIEKAKNLAIGLINAARKWVVDKLNQFRDWAKNQVNKYLKDRFPGLAKRINDGIDGFVDTAIDGVNAVADGMVAAVEAVADGLAAALDKVLQVFQTALKAAVQIAGAVMTGDFAEALRVAVQAGCDIAGIDSKPIFNFIDRAAAVIMDILKHPGKFFNNVMIAVGTGTRNFVKNIKKHLINGLIGWLTGALSEVPITLPKTFDFKGIFHLVMQILGLTYANIKARIIKKYPPAEKVFDIVEKGLEIVKRVVNEGPIALWEMAKEALSNLKEMVLGGIRSYVISTVVKEAVAWLLGMLNPAGALVKILKLVYDFIMFLVERFDQIKEFVLSVYNTLSALASGALGPVIAGVENALARSLPVVISLLARLAGLGGIGKTVQNIIGKVRKPINTVLDKLIDKVIAFVKKALGKGKAAAKKAKEAVANWWKAKTTFKADDGNNHQLYFKGEGKSATLMVASNNPGPFSKFISKVNIKPNEKDATKKAASKAKAIELAARIDKSKKEPKNTKDKVNKLLKELADHTKVLFGASGDLPVSEIQYIPASSLLGKKMVASKLTKKGPSGKKPTTKKNALYASLGKRRRGKKPYYVKGHLLNQKLHGSGEYKNLVPLSIKGNSNHEQQVESIVKAAVESGAVVKYTVEVSGGFYSAPDTSDTKLTQLPIDKKQWGKIREITQAETLVPKQLKTEAYQLEFEGGDYTQVTGERKIVSTNVDNPIDANLTNYELK